MATKSDLIPGFGIEASGLSFNSWWDWFVAYKNPLDDWAHHKSYLICQFTYIFGGITILIHAAKQGGRWPSLCIAAFLHGMVVEFLSYVLPDIDNFWHAQGILMFLGKRLPLYVMFLYINFYYHASWAVSKLKLKCPYSEYIAVGLLTVLIDMPYDIIGSNYLHWTWHDTDPNIADRHYWVPWNSYYFHFTFALSFIFFFHRTRKFFDKRDLGQWERGTMLSEIMSIVVASLMGMPGGCILFVLFYHPLHDFYNVPSEVTTITLLLSAVTIVWLFDRKSNRYRKPEKMNLISKILMFHLFLHYMVNLVTLVFVSKQDLVAVGLHETIGNCNETVPLQTLLKVLSKRKYLCPTDYDEKYFDFHCLDQSKGIKGYVPRDGSSWYTICGTNDGNLVEYGVVISLICFVAFIVFTSIHFGYDARIVARLAPDNIKRLEEPPKKKTSKKKTQ